MISWSLKQWQYLFRKGCRSTVLIHLLSLVSLLERQCPCSYFRVYLNWSWDYVDVKLVQYAIACLIVVWFTSLNVLIIVFLINDCVCHPRKPMPEFWSREYTVCMGFRGWYLSLLECLLVFVYRNKQVKRQANSQTKYKFDVRNDCFLSTNLLYKEIVLISQSTSDYTYLHFVFLFLAPCHACDPSASSSFTQHFALSTREAFSRNKLKEILCDITCLCLRHTCTSLILIGCWLRNDKKNNASRACSTSDAS